MTRAVKVVVVGILALAPTTYLAVAAVQSVNGSESKERIAVATEPLRGRPPVVMRRTYHVPMPDKTRVNRYFETNSWKTSSLYVRFDTSPRGLAQFLKELGTSRAALMESHVPITRAQQRTFGWDFHGAWAERQQLHGLTLPAKGVGEPGHRVVVNLAKQKRPSVYVVSTVSY